MQNNVKESDAQSHSPTSTEHPSKKSAECPLSSSSSSTSSSSKAKMKNNQNILGSLCGLFLSEYFTIDMLMEYLNKKEEMGVTDFLVNLLSQDKYVDKALFYLPQLCTLVKHKVNRESLEHFIIVKSMVNIKFAVSATWLFHSYSDDDPQYFLKLIDRIETSLINGAKTKQEKTDKMFIDKGNKLEHFDKTIKLYEKLKSLCEKLKLIQTKANSLKQERKKLMNKGLKAINRSIKHMLQKKSEVNSSKYCGFILPFNSNDKDDLIIVNFLPKYSNCFSTKARVPVKITVECINSSETELIEEQIENNIEEEDDDVKEDNANANANVNVNEFTSVQDFMKKMDLVSEEAKAKAIIEAVKYDNEHPGIINQINNDESGRISCDLPDNVAIMTTNSITDLPNPFEVLWEESVKKIKEKSRFRRFNSFTVKSFIAKANDDLRQELMTMQLIKKFQQIFKEANLPLHLHPYEIVITSPSSGIIEFIHDTLSIDALKKMLPSKCSLNKFYLCHFKSNFINAQKNFCESLAAYSLVSYLLSIKDRHNGNILIDKTGNIIHIDFGFILGISPGGNLNFENAPFKMTKEYVRILEGENSEIFYYFKTIFYRGLMEARKHINIFTNIIETMMKGTKMPCFLYTTSKDIIESLKDRFMVKKTDTEIMSIVDDLVYRSCNSWRTSQYDMFQKLTNGIIP